MFETTNQKNYRLISFPGSNIPLSQAMGQAVASILAMAVMILPSTWWPGVFGAMDITV